MSSATVQTDLKITIVTPIYEISDENVDSNKRQISVLPCFCNIQCKVIHYSII